MPLKTVNASMEQFSRRVVDIHFKKSVKGTRTQGETEKFAVCLPQQAFDVDHVFRLLRGTGASLLKKYSHTKGVSGSPQSYCDLDLVQLVLC